MIHVLRRNSDGQHLTFLAKWPIRPEDYKEKYASSLNRGISKQELYIKKNEPLIIFTLT
jgi:hypothetical protein